jgi:hypothetical protein
VPFPAGGDVSIGEADVPKNDCAGIYEVLMLDPAASPYPSIQEPTHA